MCILLLPIVFAYEQNTSELTIISVFVGGEIQRELSNTNMTIITGQEINANHSQVEYGILRLMTNLSTQNATVPSPETPVGGGGGGDTKKNITSNITCNYDNLCGINETPWTCPDCANITIDKGYINKEKSKMFYVIGLVLLSLVIAGIISQIKRKKKAEPLFEKEENEDEINEEDLG